MNPKEFAQSLRTTVVNENIEIYRDLFQNTKIKDVREKYWKDSLTLFSTLSEEEREIFFSIIRQVIVDTTSNLLGVIDGVCTITGQREEFLLLVDNSNQPLNGDLQDLFLEEEESKGESK